MYVILPQETFNKLLSQAAKTSYIEIYNLIEQVKKEVVIAPNYTVTPAEKIDEQAQAPSEVEAKPQAAAKRKAKAQSE